MIIDEKDITMLKNLTKCLQPIKLASGELGHRSANLLTAEAVVNFLLECLKEQTDFIRQALYETIKLRTCQRQNKNIV